CERVCVCVYMCVCKRSVEATTQTSGWADFCVVKVCFPVGVWIVGFSSLSKKVQCWGADVVREKEGLMGERERVRKREREREKERGGRQEGGLMGRERERKINISIEIAQN